MSSIIQKKYHFIFYSSQDLNNLNKQVESKNQKLNKPNKIDKFIQTISSGTTKVQFDRSLSFNDMITTLCTGYYLENNKSKLKMNASNNSLFKLCPMDQILKNPKIMDQVLQKINIGNYLKQLFKNMDYSNTNDEKIKEIISKLEDLDQPKNKEDKKNFLHLFSFKTPIITTISFSNFHYI